MRYFRDGGRSMKGRESNREARKREVIICLWDLEKSGIMNLSGSQKTFIFAAKYEQTVNMPDFTFKNAFFRIFWKILAKTGPQTLYLCGFPEARGGNEGRPFQGIDTSFYKGSFHKKLLVEMKVAPFRALTQSIIPLQERPFHWWK